MRRVLGIVFGIILSYNLQAQGTECLEGDCENGYGVEKSNNSTYYGSFLNGKKHFWGCQVYLTDQIYCGNYSQGLKHLFGTYYFTDGDNDFSMLAYDRNSKLKSGFYIDASATEGGAISMRRDALEIKPLYTPEKDGNGCVEGDCENGNGVFVYGNGEIYSGGFFDGKYAGWGCYQFFNEEKGVVDRFHCGMYVPNKSLGAGFNFVSNNNSYSFDGNEIKNTLDFKFGLINTSKGELRVGIRTAPIENKEERDWLQYEFDDKPFKSASMSGAEGPYQYQIVCMYGNCKNDALGFSIKSNFDDKDWSGQEIIGVYTKDLYNSSINGYACSYSPAHSNLPDETQNGNENLVCGNFINGEPMYFMTMYNRNKSSNENAFYFGLTKGYEIQYHGVLGVEGGFTGWQLETAQYDDN